MHQTNVSPLTMMLVHKEILIAREGVVLGIYRLKAGLFKCQLPAAEPRSARQRVHACNRLLNKSTNRTQVHGYTNPNK